MCVNGTSGGSLGVHSVLQGLRIMAPRQSAVLLFRFALIISASIVLANCATPQTSLLGHVPAPMTTRSEAQEIPLQDPVIDSPTAEDPQAPQVASNMPRPRPPARRPPLVKPAPAVPSKDIPSEPETGAAAVAPGDLVGFDFPHVLAILRRPDMVQNSALSIVWTYAQSDCTLQLYFYPDIQTRIFHLLKFDLKDGSGERPNDSSSCMRHMARNDEPASP
jgi:hypothetical protein